MTRVLALLRAAWRSFSRPLTDEEKAWLQTW